MIDVKPAGIKDAALISAIGAKSFIEAFGAQNKKEDIELYIAEKFNLEHIKEEVSDPKASFFLAYYEGKPAGYAKLIHSPLPEKIKDTNAIEMQRIYALKEYYNMKVGKELMMHTLDFAFSKGFDAMWLGVWQLNDRAVEFYKQWGFEVFDTRNFTLGNDIKDDFLMIKKF
jgi:ribosomal protein S18 acetylase RimI-like enzyme